MAKRSGNPDFLNGVPELLILRLLSTRPMYGYQLVRAIRVATGETLTFGEGCIYPILHRLEAERLLEGRREKVGGRSRVVYRITPGGKKKLTESVGTWQRIVEAVQQVLEGAAHEQPASA